MALRGCSWLCTGVFHDSNLLLKTEEGIRRAMKEIKDSTNHGEIIFLNVIKLEG